MGSPIRPEMLRQPKEPADMTRRTPRITVDPVTQMREALKNSRAAGEDEDQQLDVIQSFLPLIEQFGEQEASDVPRKGGFLQTLAGGATAGFDDEITGLLRGPEERDAARARKQSFFNRSPAAAIATDVVGSAVTGPLNVAMRAPGMIGAKGATRAVTPFASRLGRAMVQGGGAGMAAGAGNADGRDMATSAAVGAGLGAGLSGVATLASPVVSTVMNRLSPERSMTTARDRLATTVANARPQIAQEFDRLRGVGRQDKVTLAEVLSNAVSPEEGIGALRASRTVGGYPAEQIVDPIFRGRQSQMGSDVRQLLTESTGFPMADMNEWVAEQAGKRRTLGQTLYDQGRQEWDAYQAGQRAAVTRAQEAASGPKYPMLPAPGQSEVAKSGLADELARHQESVERAANVGRASELSELAGRQNRASLRAAIEDFNRTRYTRKPPETVMQGISREGLETLRGEPLFRPENTGNLQRPPASLVEGVPPRRDVRMEAANDVNVRRPFAEPEVQQEPVFTGRDPRDVQARFEQAAADPVVQDYVRFVQQDPSIPGIQQADDYVLLTEAYKSINRDIGGLKRSPLDSDTRRQLMGLSNAAAQIRNAIGEVSPSWLKANDAWAQESGILETFQEGGELMSQARSASTNVTPGTIGMRRQALPPEQEPFLRAGALSDLRQQTMAKAPNPDFGEDAPFLNTVNAVAGNEAAGESLRRMFGQEAYDKMVPRFRQLLEEVAASNAVRGGSNTANKLLEAQSHMQANLSQLGSSAVLGASGSNVPAFAAMARGVAPAITDKIKRFIEQPTAIARAQLLSTMGEKEIQDLVEILSQEATRPPTLSQRTGARLGGALVRSTAGQSQRVLP